MHNKKLKLLPGHKTQMATYVLELVKIPSQNICHCIVIWPS